MLAQGCDFDMWEVLWEREVCEHGGCGYRGMPAEG